MHRTRLLKFALMVSALCFAVTYRPAPTHAQNVTAMGIPADDSAMTEDPSDGPLRRGHNQRSPARLMGDALLRNVHNGGLGDNPIWSGQAEQGEGEHHDAADGNVQINDAALDHIVSFPGLTRPFEFSTQSETSVAANGKHIVVGYNSSANQVIQLFPQGLFYTKRLFTAYSVSHDGGRTWTSGFVPPAAGSNFTFGDPAVAVDRRGNFFYASVAADAGGNTVIIVNKSSDHGSTFGIPAIAATDNGGDKDWLAVGPDPVHRDRDNLYVTWTSFAADGSGSSLWLSRSTDGGTSWTSKQLFAPTDNGTTSSSFIQFSNPVVDASTGRLYIPFLHFSDIDADNIKVLVSDDGGDTFQFLNFNVAGWPDPTGFPNVTPGEIADCGRNNGGFRNVLHQGSSDGGGRLGLARYVQATRLVTQPATAAANGRLLIAFQSSTSPFSGDPTAGSTIKLLYSRDGGNTWAPTLTVAASTAADPQHVHPAIALDEVGESVFITYYTQQADTRLRTDVTSGKVEGKHIELKGTTHLSTTAFDITPNNIPHPILNNPFFTTNYDRSIVACYNIGEYMSVAAAEDGPLAAWGDNRNSWTGPPDSAAPGKHAQPDVFFSRGGKE